jgi:hypothetical protein
MASVVGKQPTSPPLSRVSSDFFERKGCVVDPESRDLMSREEISISLQPRFPSYSTRDISSVTTDGPISPQCGVERLVGRGPRAHSCENLGPTRAAAAAAIEAALLAGSCKLQPQANSKIHGLCRVPDGDSCP